MIEMLYSKTVKYAVLALAEIARRAPDGAVPTKVVAEEASVPYSLLAKILVRLKTDGLVAVLRGKNGGVDPVRVRRIYHIDAVITYTDSTGSRVTRALLTVAHGAIVRVAVTEGLDTSTADATVR